MQGQIPMELGAPIVTFLRETRKAKGLSQHDLGERVGLPQSHISKIESGAVDIQMSSLIELARVLDLEVMLVPRILVPTVQALQRGDRGSTPLYRLEDEDTTHER